MSDGRFVKSFPSDFPMRIGDLCDSLSLLKVSAAEWVQNLLRYWTGHFVGGMRGQRVVWAMVNTLLLEEARSRGFGIYRNVMRRVGYGLEGGAVLTKARLREMLNDEDPARVLVNQLMNVGRDVRSTPMQWPYEGKKLDATVKHLSFRPPLVEPGEEESDNEGRRYLGSDTWCDVPDNVGLSTYPSTWWTLNCKYNAAYDVHRLKTGKDGRAAVDESCDGKKLERFLFVKYNPDIVTYMLALRTGLTMHIVMPPVVPHSLRAPYMSMSRFETGPNGNPHYHGFSVGARGPRMNRVRPDVDGVGDAPRDVDMEIRQILDHVFGTCEETGAGLDEEGLGGVGRRWLCRSESLRFW